MLMHNNLQFDIESFDLFSFSQSLSSNQSPDNFLCLDRHERERLKPILWFQLYCYFLRQFNFNFEEETMFNSKLIRFLILDLIDNHGYTYEEVANDAGIPEAVVEDIAYGTNTNPSSMAFVRIMMLYIMNRPSEYTEKIRRILQLLEYWHVNFLK